MDEQRAGKQIHRYRSKLAKLSVLLEKAISLSDALSSYTMTDRTLPRYLDKAWEELSLAIEASRSSRDDEALPVAEARVQANDFNTYWAFMFGDGSIWTDDLFQTKERGERFLNSRADAELVQGATLTEVVIAPVSPQLEKKP